MPAILVQYALESWGVTFGVRLRSSAAVLHQNELFPLFKERGFSHPSSSGGAYVPMASMYGSFSHDFVTAVSGGQKVVTDNATGLMWLPAEVPLNASDGGPLPYLARLNAERHAGFADWRQPTIEEIGALIEPRAIDADDRRQFLDAAFNFSDCTSVDEVVIESDRRRYVLAVNFVDGRVYASDSDRRRLCAVRSVQAGEQGAATTAGAGAK
jgi:hypothetical protein